MIAFDTVRRAPWAWPTFDRQCDTLSGMPATEKRSVDLRVRLRPSEAEKLQELAEQEDEPVSATVRRAIRRYIEESESS